MRRREFIWWKVPKLCCEKCIVLIFSWEISFARLRSRAGLFEGRMFPARRVWWDCWAVPVPARGWAGWQQQARRELCSGQEPTPMASLCINTVQIPSARAASKFIDEAVQKKQKQLHSRRDLPPFWVTVAVQGPQFWGHGENKLFEAFQGSPQCSQYTLGACRRCNGRTWKQCKWRGNWLLWYHLRTF